VAVGQGVAAAVVNIAEEIKAVRHVVRLIKAGAAIALEAARALQGAGSVQGASWTS
jgi:hypothetical protein